MVNIKVALPCNATDRLAPHPPRLHRLSTGTLGMEHMQALAKPARHGTHRKMRDPH